MGNSQSSQTSLPEGKWHWQSNQNPWNNNEPSEWTAYSESDSNLIDEAFLKKQDRVDLKTHYILLSKQLQVSKKDSKKQRKVKRIITVQHSTPEREIERFCGELPTPKIINNPYGELENLIKFLGYKIEVCYDITRSLDSDSFRILGYIEAILEGIREEAQILDKKKEVMEFQKDFYFQFGKTSQETQDEILRTVLKAYTRETFLYRRINQILREEDWDKIKNLAPYLVCLANAFANGKYSPKFDVNIKIEETDEEYIPLILYRGAKLDRQGLKAYEIETSKIFSWNGVTSTSRKRNIAESFLGKPTDEKACVLFVIQTKIFKEVAKNRNMIDISAYSVFPSEDEIILAPGTAFKMVSKKQIGHICEITLELISDFEGLRSQGGRFVGEMQSNLYDGFGHSSIIGLKDEDVDEALKYIANRQLQKITISSCEFSVEIMEQILKLVIAKNLYSLKISDIRISRETTEAFVRHLPKTSLKNIEFCITGMGLSAETFRMMLRSLPSSLKELKIEGSKKYHNDELVAEMGEILSYSSVCKFTISNFKLDEDSMKKMCQGKLKNFVELIFENCIFESDSLCYLLEKVPETSIGSLILDSNIYLTLSGEHKTLNQDTSTPVNKNKMCKYRILCQNYSEETEIGFSNLTKALESSSILHLEINLPIDDSKIKISQDEQMSLLQGINGISTLEMLDFRYNPSYKVTGAIVSQTIKLLSASTFLKGLCTNFEREKLPEEGLVAFFGTLNSYSKLESLIFNGRNCSITDNTSTAIYDFLQSSQLQSLHLSLGRSVMTEETLLALINSISTAKSLRVLALDLSDIKTFSSTHLRSLSLLLGSLPNLKDLQLRCDSVSFLKEDFVHFSACLAVLNSLNALTLEFSSEVIGNQEYLHLIESLSSLVSLVSFKLTFRCANIIEINPYKALKSMTNLKALKLDYRWTSASDAEVIALGQSLALLKQLNTVEILLGHGCSSSESGFREFRDSKAELADVRVINLSYSCSKTLSNAGIIGFCKAIKSTDDCAEGLYADFYEKAERLIIGIREFDQAIEALSSSKATQMSLIMVFRAQTTND